LQGTGFDMERTKGREGPDIKKKALSAGRGGRRGSGKKK